MFSRSCRASAQGRPGNNVSHEPTAAKRGCFEGLRILHDALLLLMLTGINACKIVHDPCLLQNARQPIEAIECLPSQQVHSEGSQTIKSSRHRTLRCLYRAEALCALQLGLLLPNIPV